MKGDTTSEVCSGVRDANALDRRGGIADIEGTAFGVRLTPHLAVANDEVAQSEMSAGIDEEESIRSAEVDDIAFPLCGIGAANEDMGALDGDLRVPLRERIGTGKREDDLVARLASWAGINGQVGLGGDQRLAQRAFAIGGDPVCERCDGVGCRLRLERDEQRGGDP